MKAIVLICFALMTIGCKKTYTCNCVDKSAGGEELESIDFEIPGKEREEAEKRCAAKQLDWMKVNEHATCELL